MKKVVVLLLGLFFGSANAQLQLKLTQGLDEATPIALSTWSCSGSGAASIADQLFTIVRDDLAHSGAFAINQHKPIYQIQGRVSALGKDQWQACVTLNALGGGQSAHNAVLSRCVKSPSAQLRQLAHAISDVLYQKMVGVPGIFSTHLAYVLVTHDRAGRAHYALQVADADGQQLRTLLRSDQPLMSPAWSPDGQQLAYVSFEHHQARIYLQSLATGKRTRVIDSPGINGAPAFSPDGRMLAMVLSRSGNPKIYLWDRQQQKLSVLTTGASIDTEPAWSPDGQSIIFTSNRGGVPQIYQQTLSNRQVTQLTFDGRYNARASWFPDGQHCVMMHEEAGYFGIARYEPSTGQWLILTQSQHDESPSVAPNGQMVVYTHQAGGKSRLGLVSADGRVKLQLPSSEGDVREPAWSPYSSVLKSS